MSGEKQFGVFWWFWRLGVAEAVGKAAEQPWWGLGMFATGLGTNSFAGINGAAAPPLAENPSSSCREMLESKGILVADITTFLGTVQEVAAPFRRSYW